MGWLTWLQCHGGGVQALLEGQDGKARRKSCPLCDKEEVEKVFFKQLEEAPLTFTSPGPRGGTLTTLMPATGRRRNRVILRKIQKKLLG